MGQFLGILLVFGLITFTAYQVIGLVKSIKEKKKGKIDEKGDDTE